MTDDNRHPLKSLLITQFFGAFNDNAWKLIVTFLAIRALQSSFTGTEVDFQAASQFQTTLAFCVLTLPLMLFSLPADDQGLLIVRGPNVMKGYLGRDDLTQSVFREGWYVTGDIALVNEDGFLKITDRLSRFSKIGGEMVPHGRVEEALHQAAEVEQLVFSVTAVADDRKGESLAVIHIHDEETIPEILKKLGEMGLPNLFIPRKDKFLKVDELPLLGSGKINLKEAKRIATEHFQ